MPGFDKTGPMGQGSQTGRKMGKCNGENNPQTESRSYGRHMGKGLKRRNGQGDNGGNRCRHGQKQ